MSIELTFLRYVIVSCRHKFEDGKLKGDSHPDAHWRHCVLSFSLRFVPEAEA
jgi:hypothetical protein